MTLPVIGIMGLGFLGQTLAGQGPWAPSSWGTRLERPVALPRNTCPLKMFSFDWQEPSQWKKLPAHPSSLILTIPPICADVDQEIERLQRWGSWMNRYRPGCETLVYISTTGVYPNRDGEWHETSVFEPDSLQGKLRLATETTLARFFSIKVIRPGAIYGNNRHIGHRILAGKPIPEGKHPVHRIHVTDLAQIVQQAVTQVSFPSPINAVDLDPAPTAEAAEWLLNQNFKMMPAGTRMTVKPGYTTRTNRRPSIHRFVSNRRLIEDCHYAFRYPTYKEGFADAFHEPGEA
ncbi:hypothetical protein KKI24_21350 [bacterium]|nr:hypothetical protein [bacterium]